PDDFLERDDELLLVVDQAAQRGQLRAAGELADVPRVLREEVVRALFRRADEARAVVRRRARHAVEPARADARIARIDERAHLKQDAVAILQRADHWPRVAAGKEMPVQRRE